MSDHDCNFQEVSGLNVSLGIEEIKEGGENKFIHRIPTPPKYENLILKRGMFQMKDSELIRWAQNGIATFSFDPRDINIFLLDETGVSLAAWNIKNAYAVGIKVSNFKSMENAIVVESLELAFTHFERIK